MTAESELSLAFGRILRMTSRPEQPGDIAEYERCRSIIIDRLAPEGLPPLPIADYGRDRNRGAAGD